MRKGLTLLVAVILSLGVPEPVWAGTTGTSANPLLQLNAYQDVAALKDAAERGNNDAALKLCIVYWRGNDDPPVSIDLEQSFSWCRRAAAEGSSKAQLYLGRHYMASGQPWRDYAKSHEQLVMALEGGEWAALAYLGNLYERGLGVPRDQNMAERLAATRRDVLAGAMDETEMAALLADLEANNNSEVEVLEESELAPQPATEKTPEKIVSRVEPAETNTAEVSIPTYDCSDGLYVTSEALNLRDKPKGQKIGQLEFAERVCPIGAEETWVRVVTSDLQTGWAYYSFLDEAKPVPVVRAEVQAPASSQTASYESAPEPLSCETDLVIAASQNLSGYLRRQDVSISALKTVCAPVSRQTLCGRGQTAVHSPFRFVWQRETGLHIDGGAPAFEAFWQQTCN